MRKWILILAVLVAAAAAPPPDGKGGSFRKRQPAAQYVDQITNFFSQHRWTKGKELLDQGLEQYPDNPNLHYLAGRYWWNGKNYDRARYHLVKACQINYHFVDAKTLLVNVEEITGNYSSAVCYVNELLEVNPYWKGLWLRKVDLYKKMGNFEEANALLQRLSQIYPSDASITGDYFDVLETTYQQARRNGDLSAAEDALREIVRITPTDTDYQLAYANVLLRQGKTSDALDNLTFALNANPGNVPLIKKTTDILMSSGRNMGALSLVRAQMAEHRSPELEKLYETLLAESARMENEADPYALYARVYDKDGSMEALQYLLNQSAKRGYYDDAIYYIDQMRRRRGDSPKWYMMEFDVYTRMGRHESAAKALETGLKLYPDDYDLNLAICRRRLTESGQEMAEGRYTQAIPMLEFVHRHAADPELKASAVRRLAVCYRETNQMDNAVMMLRERLKTDPEYQVTVDYAALLVKQGRPEAALRALQASYDEASDSLSARMLGNAYRETAYPYLKEKLQNGANIGLQPITDQILTIDPRDYWGLRYSLRTADNPLPYAFRGMEVYPDDLTFPIAAARELVRRGEQERALNTLRSYLEVFPADEDLQRNYAGISEQVGSRLYRDKEFDRAEAVLDSALRVRPGDPSLRYTRGLLYEKRHQWDSAYVYQSKYQPSVLEEAEFKARMNAIRARTLHNTVDAGFDLFRFTDSQHLMSMASLGYSRFWIRDELSLRMNYSGRDSEWDSEDQMYTSVGGRGLQLTGGWTHHFDSRWSVLGSIGLSNNFFPRLNLDASITRHLSSDWDLEAGLQYRFLRDESSMYALNLGAYCTRGHFYTGGKVMLGTMHDVLFYNAQLRLRFYPMEGGRSYVEAQGGWGTAPEISFLNYYYNSSVYNHLNSFVAVTASWALNYNLALQLSGTWNTLYDQRNIVSYRNLLMAHVTLAVSF